MHRAAHLLLICASLFSLFLCNTSVAAQDTKSTQSAVSPSPIAAAGDRPATDVAAPPTGVAVPPNPLGEATILFRKGDLDGAFAKYQAIIAANSKSPDAYAGIVQIYLKRKDVNQAYETVKKALQVADSVPVRVALGEVYFRQGKIPEAEQEWVKVINSGRQSARAFYGLAKVRAALSMYKSAWTMLDKAHQLDPADPEIRRMWIAKLDRAARIKFYEDYLAGENNEDAETRANLKHYLDYLKARSLNSSPCQLTTKATATEAPLLRLLSDAQHLRGFGLPVSINGENFHLLLDTGASGILINRRAAEKAGVIKLSDIEMGGIGDKGRKSGYIGLAKSLKVGNLEFQNCPVSVLQDRSVVGEDGLVGSNVFGGFLVDLDFAHEKLRLSQLPKRPGETASKLDLQTSDDDEDAQENESDKDQKDQKHSDVMTDRLQDRYIAPEMNSYTRVYRFGHLLLVPTLVGGSPSKLFALDTGSFSNTISPATAREVTRVRGEAGTTVKGISGSVDKVFSADKAVLQFGHLRQENQDLIAFDMTHLSDNVGTEVSGFLGFTLLRLLEIKIDYRDGLVDFEYDPALWKWLQ